MNKHRREKIATTNDYDIKSSLNHRQIYIKRVNEEVIENIHESVDYLLDHIRPFKSYKLKSRLPVYMRREMQMGN